MVHDRRIIKSYTDGGGCRIRFVATSRPVCVHTFFIPDGVRSEKLAETYARSRKENNKFRGVTVNNTSLGNGAKHIFVDGNDGVLYVHVCFMYVSEKNTS